MCNLCGRNYVNQKAGECLKQNGQKFRTIVAVADSHFTLVSRFEGHFMAGRTCTQSTRRLGLNLSIIVQHGSTSLEHGF